VQIRLLSYALAVSWSCSLLAAEPRPGPALLRMERVRTGEAVCILVHGDGSYRLEKLFRAKTEMYTGQLEASQIDRLQSLLQEDQFRKLVQDDLHGPTFTDSIDKIDLSVWRGRGWQNIVFRSPEDRKPVHGTIEPLLKWFQDVQKQRPGAASANGTPTRCMPTSPTTGAMASETTDRIVPSDPTFLFRFLSRDADLRAAETKCTVVFLDGSYRLKWRKQESRGDEKVSMTGGKLDASALQELRDILNSPTLTNASTAEVPTFLSGTQLQEVSVDIPRAKEMQRLEFVREFNHASSPREIGGMNNLSYLAGDQSVLSALEHWMKDHTDRGGIAIVLPLTQDECDAGVTKRKALP
jgi:hypothetical protein